MPDITRMPQPAPARVLALGAFLKNRACLIEGPRIGWSIRHGDLSESTACLALEQSADSLTRLCDAGVQAVAHDRHPDFYSTQLALAAAERLSVPAVAVQHHHAHIATVIAARGLLQPVIGIALDGVGLGADDQAWGGEILQVDGGRAAHHWRRVAYLHPLLLPGGDTAAREPWRLAAALLHETGRSAEIVPRFAPSVGEQAARVVQQMLERKLNCPASTSAGRWFDAAAGTLGLSMHQTHEAEAAMRLESSAVLWLEQNPDFTHPWETLDLRPIVTRLFDIDHDNEDAVGRGAAIFHLALVNGLARAAISATQEHAIEDVVLSGGCFMNSLLRLHLSRALTLAGLRVHLLPASHCGDAGLALGQAWVAACTLVEDAVSENY